MTTNGTSPLVFSDGDKGKSKEKKATNPWKIFIVDDDVEVHSVTKLALSGFTFGGRPLEFLHAFSGKEARAVFEKTHDIALVLLDVVMETDHSGLDTVKYIRENLGNRITRIVLRTGQPGQAPERHVVTEYDINDYKEKTELTSQKLFTLISASLRSYRDIVALNNSRKGLRKIIDASATIFSLNSMREFAEGVLSQMLSMLHIQDKGSFYSESIDALAAFKSEDDFKIIAGTGRFSASEGQENHPTKVPPEVIENIFSATAKDNHSFEKNHIHIFDPSRIVSYHKGRGRHENLLLVDGEIDFNEIDESLIELYARNVGIAFENIELHAQYEEAQLEIVYMLGEAVETRSTETGNHLKRVAEISNMLALKSGLPDFEAKRLKYASPLHDVGKIGIPDAILNKPGKLDAGEWKIMQSHAELGHKMLSHSTNPILQAGATIALEHHEKWNGDGYPHGKKGNDIHMFGRVTALADVIDALGSRRCYKDAWAPADVRDYISSERGKQFDPKLVDIATEGFGEIMNILEHFSDGAGGNKHA